MQQGFVNPHPGQLSLKKQRGVCPKYKNIQVKAACKDIASSLATSSRKRKTLILPENNQPIPQPKPLQQHSLSFVVQGPPTTVTGDNLRVVLDAQPETRPGCRLTPHLLNFNDMVQQLSQWHAKYKTSHVPRHAFDAPDLGAWVRYMRRAFKIGLLEQWKIDVLNTLEFQWEISEQDARWHSSFHHLRRFKLVHGHTQLPRCFNDTKDLEWVRCARWLHRQARLLAKEKLPSHKQHMLSVLGVQLRVTEASVRTYARLRGLNGHERKLERRRIKMELLEQRKRRTEARDKAIAASRASLAGSAALAARRHQLRALAALPEQRLLMPLMGSRAVGLLGDGGKKQKQLGSGAGHGTSVDKGGGPQQQQGGDGGGVTREERRRLLLRQSGLAV